MVAKIECHGERLLRGDGRQESKHMAKDKLKLEPAGIEAVQESTVSWKPRDVLAELRDGSAALPEGEVVMSSTLSLLESMNAIEIMDPRIDTGMITQEEKEQPPFQPKQTLPAEVVLHVMDELLRREMTFYAGHALPHTLFTCLYVTQFRDFPSVDDMEGEHPPEMVALVLKAYVLATMKMVDIVWGEMIRGNVKEGEDVQTDKADVYLAEDISPDQVFNLLDTAYDWLQMKGAQQRLAEAGIMDRLRMRMELLYALCVLFEPYDASPDAQYHSIGSRMEDCRDILNMLRRCVPPRPDDTLFAGIFDVNTPRRLPTNAPPRPIQLRTLRQSYADLDDLLLGITVSQRMTLLTTWSSLERTFLSLARRRPSLPPFLRSAAQSLFFADAKVLRHHSQAWLGVTFLDEVAGWSDCDLDSLLDTTDYAERVALRKELDKWIGALASRLVNFISILGANRPKQKRMLEKSIIDWQRFLRQTGDLLNSFTHLPSQHSLQSITWSVERTIGLIALEALFAGFDLELYSPSEQMIVYWLVDRVLDRQVGTLESMLSDGTRVRRQSLERELAWTVSLKGLAGASLKLLACRAALDLKADDAYWHMRFSYRFDWLPAKLRTTSGQQGWSAFCAHMAALRHDDARSDFAEAEAHLKRLAANSPADLPVDDEKQNTMLLGNIAFANAAALESLDPQAGRVIWRHPWFPSLVAEL